MPSKLTANHPSKHTQSAKVENWGFLPDWFCSPYLVCRGRDGESGSLLFIVSPTPAQAWRGLTILGFPVCGLNSQFSWLRLSWQGLSRRHQSLKLSDWSVLRHLPLSLANGSASLGPPIILVPRERSVTSGVKSLFASWGLGDTGRVHLEPDNLCLKNNNAATPLVFATTLGDGSCDGRQRGRDMPKVTLLSVGCFKPQSLNHCKPAASTQNVLERQQKKGSWWFPLEIEPGPGGRGKARVWAGFDFLPTTGAR